MLKSMRKKTRSAKKKSKSATKPTPSPSAPKKPLNEYKDKLPADVATDIQSKIDAVKKALEGKNNSSEIKAAHDDLNDAHAKNRRSDAKTSGAQAGPQPGPQPGPSASKEKPDIEEAEVEILEDEKK